jgi:transposase
LLTSTRCGLSTKQLERELGVGYKTADRMRRRIEGRLMLEPANRRLPRELESEPPLGRPLGPRRADGLRQR